MAKIEIDKNIFNVNAIKLGFSVFQHITVELTGTPLKRVPVE